MSDEEFWRHLALGRLFVLMGATEADEDERARMRALEANGF